MRWLLAVLLGAGLGVAAGVADTAVARDPLSDLRALGTATDTVSVWVLAAVIGGWLMARQPWSALAGPVVLASGLVGWYTWMATQSVHHFGVGQLPAETQYWVLAGVVLGPFFGILGSLSRASNSVGLCARITAPVAMVAELVMRHPLGDGQFHVDPVTAWTSAAMMGAGVLMTMVAVVSQQGIRSQ